MTQQFEQITSPPQAQAEVIVNESLEAVQHVAVYGYKKATSSGLTWGYYGGEWNGFTVVAGTLALTASSTNYIVVARATGVISVSTSNTNWNDTTNYARVYQVVTGASTVTTITDGRQGPSGILVAGGGTFTGGTLTSALNEAPQVALASAATVNIGAAAANTVTVSGTTTITAFDSIATGAIRRVRFLAALTMTHNATSLILPGSANITTAAGDVATMESLGSGNWRCISYQRADGQAVVGSSSRTPSVQTVTSAATVTPTFSDDAVKITAQAVGLTLANPTGTAIPMLGMVIRIKDNGTSRSITYGSQYRAIGVTLPANTVAGKTLYLGMIYNSDDTKWDVLSVGQEA